MVETDRVEGSDSLTRTPEKVYVILTTLTNPSRAENVRLIAVRFDGAAARRELREMIYHTHRHDRFQDQALNAQELLRYHNDWGRMELGDGVWWVSHDHMLWISDKIRYEIREVDSTTPMTALP